MYPNVTSGQSYQHFTIAIYNSGVAVTGNWPKVHLNSGILGS